MENKDSQVFATGFGLGMLTGVVGYFLFGTKRGQQLRKSLSQEWQHAQSHLQEQGVLSKSAEEKEQSLSEFLNQLKNQILTELDLDLDDQPVKPAKKRTYQKKKNPRQFTGT